MIAPDFIAAEQGWRTWKLTSDNLLNSVSFSATWEPGEPMVAECRKTARAKRWQCVPMDDAVESGALMAQDWSKDEYGSDDGLVVPRPPRVVLPFTHSYIYHDEEPHQSPAKGCACGIYAAHKPSQCAGYGKYVLGRVNLWGQVIPGDKGYRAEFAYPSELFVLTEPIPEPARNNSMYLMLSFSSPPEEKPPTDIQVAALGEYGVPVRRVASYRDALASVEAVAA